MIRGLRLLDLLSWERFPVSSLALFRKYEEQYGDMNLDEQIGRRAMYRNLKLLAEEGWIECVECHHFAAPDGADVRSVQCKHRWRLGTISLRLVERIETDTDAQVGETP